MPAKPAFTEAQIHVLRETAKRVRKRFRTQEDFALALGITQPSLSSLLQGKWRPGVTTAKAIAHLEQVSLEDSRSFFSRSDFLEGTKARTAESSAALRPG